MKLNGKGALTTQADFLQQRPYGRSERNKYRAVVYYLLTKHFGKESVYG